MVNEVQINEGGPQFPGASVKFLNYVSGLECYSKIDDKRKRIWLTDSVLESVKFSLFLLTLYFEKFQSYRKVE